jgi:hypothetical protein
MWLIEKRTTSEAPEFLTGSTNKWQTSHPWLTIEDLPDKEVHETQKLTPGEEEDKEEEELGVSPWLSVCQDCVNYGYFHCLVTSVRLQRWTLSGLNMCRDDLGEDRQSWRSRLGFAWWRSLG